LHLIDSSNLPPDRSASIPLKFNIIGFDKKKILEHRKKREGETNKKGKKRT